MGTGDAFGTEEIIANKWYHVVATFDGNSHKLYVDNVLNDQIEGTLSSSNTLPINIGRKNTGESWSYFDGRIDEVTIYNYALTAEEIQELYEEPSKVIIPPSNLIATPGDNRVILSWDEVTGVDGYNVYRSIEPSSGYSKLNAGLIAGTTFTDKTCSNDLTYYYQVTAVKGNDESMSSSELNATPVSGGTGDTDDEKDEKNKGFLPGFETHLLLIGFFIVLIYLQKRKRNQN